MTARQVALSSLIACDGQGGWSDGTLLKNIRAAALDRREAALATRLCYGVLQNKMLIDFYIRHFSKNPARMERKVLAILRLGVYQLLFMDKIPASAAVNESVKLAQSGRHGVAGFVNGVLRAIDRARDGLPSPEGDAITRLSIQYSHPAWIVKEFSLTIGLQQTEALLRENNCQPEIFAQVNTLKTTAAALSAALTELGVSVRTHPWLADCLMLRDTGDMTALAPFAQGHFYIQDAASRLCAMALGVKAGQRMLDVCAAPGGKSFAAAIAAGDLAPITAWDVHPHKKRLIEAGAARLGLRSISAMTWDARTARDECAEQFDAVLADVPCSGLGIIRKKPDIREKDPARLAELPALQSAILENAARCVRRGGRLIYSTCTLRVAENGDVTAAFLQKHPHFALDPFDLPGPLGRADDGAVTLYPHLHGTDGFYIARFVRRV